MDNYLSHLNHLLLFFNLRFKSRIAENKSLLTERIINTPFALAQKPHLFVTLHLHYPWNIQSLSLFFLSSFYFPFFVIALVSKFNTGYGIQMS